MQAVKSGSGWDEEEQFPCDQMCMQDGELVHEYRSLYRCALPGFPESHWQKDKWPTRKHMGALKILQPTREDLNIHPNLRRPSESHEDGCPGSWYRCGFIRSLVKYERLLTDSGFCQNVHLERTDDPLIVDALQFYEREQLRCRNDNNERRSDSYRS